VVRGSTGSPWLPTITAQDGKAARQCRDCIVNYSLITQLPITHSLLLPKGMQGWISVPQSGSPSSQYLPILLIEKHTKKAEPIPALPFLFSIFLGICLFFESPHSSQAHKTKAKKKHGERLGNLFRPQIADMAYPQIPSIEIDRAFNQNTFSRGS
jgi:hypothetical protein